MRIKTGVATAALVLVAGFAQPAAASVIFDWVCDNPVDCTDPGGVFRGSIEFDESGYAAGATFSDGTGKILSFIFESTVGSFPAADQPWVLAGLVPVNPLSSLTWTFSGDGRTLTDLGHPGNAAQCVGQGPGEICFGTPFGDALNVTAFEVEDVNNVTESGHWELRGDPVPEPGTLALISLGLAGLGASRRRK